MPAAEDRLTVSRNFFSTPFVRDFPHLQFFPSMPNLPLYRLRLEAEVLYLLIEPLSAMPAPALPPPHRSGLLSVLHQTRLNRVQEGTQESAPYLRQSRQSVCTPSIPRRP